MKPWWQDEMYNEFESYMVLNYISEFFDYDHELGRLRWTRDDAVWDRLPAAMKRNCPKGAVAGTTCRPGYDYEIKVDGILRNALSLIWEHQTGNSIRRVMTIEPNETRFSIDNLCLIPGDGRRALRYRAKKRKVVSWSHERKQFTVVQVDVYYCKTILSYHDDIDDAIAASKQPVVSFL